MHHKPRLVGGVKAHHMNDNTLPGSPALWAESFITDHGSLRQPRGYLEGIEELCYFNYLKEDGYAYR